MWARALCGSRRRARVLTGRLCSVLGAVAEMTQFCYIEANMTGKTISHYNITEQLGSVTTATPSSDRHSCRSKLKT